MENFSKKVMQLIQAKLGDEVTIKLENVIKTNDMNLTAVTIGYKDENTGLNIYLDSYYESFKQGCPLEKILEKLIEQYQSAKDDIPRADMLVHLKDLEYMKEHITIRLLNKKMNEEYLKGKCYMEYLDFVIVFAIIIDEKQGASTMVLEELRKIWDVSKEELYEIAIANMQTKLPCKISPIQDVILGLRGMVSEDMDELVSGLESLENPFYVMTNKSEIYGAVTILYQDALKEFAEEHQAEYIMMIPSSVHEWILVLEDETLSDKFLYDLVREVNDTEVRKEEVLSYNIYQYDCQTDKVSIWSQDDTCSRRRFGK